MFWRRPQSPASRAACKANHSRRFVHTLTAVFSGGTGSINNSIGTVTSGQVVNVSPTTTTTYTLTSYECSDNTSATTHRDGHGDGGRRTRDHQFPRLRYGLYWGREFDHVDGGSQRAGTGSINNGVGAVTSGNAYSGISPRIDGTVYTDRSPTPRLTPATVTATTIRDSALAANESASHSNPTTAALNVNAATTPTFCAHES